MVERMKDDDDRKLEALLRAPAIADDGFSERVVRRVRRRVWVRRWTLPIAAAIGALIAAKPLMDLLALLPLLADLVPRQLEVLPLPLLEQLPALFSAVLFIGVATTLVRLAGD